MKPNPTVKKLLDEVSKHIIGKKEILKMLLVSLLSEGHSLLEGPPGTGKTLIAKSFAQAIGGTFRRVQMTPDMLPADIIGTVFYDMPKGEWRLKQGPIFANVVLIDELNRAPSKTQAALLEAMQERQVTIEGQTLPLPNPFLVLATQLPYGGEGTYPLTEVQMDRIAYQIQVDYPSSSEEIEIISRIDELEKPQVEPVATPEEVSKIIGEVKNVHVSEPVKSYIVNLVNEFRRAEEVRSGPSTRASIWLYKGSRALAYLEGRGYVIPDDVKKLATIIFPHRIKLKPEYEAEGVSKEEIIGKILSEVKVPKT